MSPTGRSMSPLPDKPCRWCRERFTPKNGQQLYCSMQCSRAQHRVWQLARQHEQARR